MILLLPSKTIRQKTGIDFDLLTHILSYFIQTDQTVAIYVYKSKTDISWFYPEEQIISVALSNREKDMRYIITVILHELRHYIQATQFDSVFAPDYSSFNQYYNSPEEKDARAFEKISSEVYNIYKLYNKIDTKLNKISLNIPHGTQIT